MTTPDDAAFDARYVPADPYYAGWAPAPPRPRTDGLAIAALVTALVGLGLVAVGLGVAALVRIRRRGTAGRGLAIAGVVIGALEMVVAIALVVTVVLTWQQTRPLAGDVDHEQTVHARQLVAGTCLRELPPDGTVDEVTAVPCAQAHEAEVVSVYDFDAAAVWPGQAQADARVARSCELSDDEQAAGARIVTWAPTQQGWSRGDRSGLCLVVTG
ncbi:DUF4190 domain-containing protein [Cellulomonas composti]|uniref:DUF4190 domain-containing protein n=1 Tax=Cellulomonas composti TaxID=266130 RepID=A0A511JBG3_9CELL|nr:DUF4190 domain-containing protein [Cellulomonas composti]GEL95331.1 hypothetical protein CCO02nite_19890 [Cellulomonas composti]